VLLPSALPFVLTGLRVAIPIMLIVTTVTEFIGDSQGLGHLIARSAAYFDTAAALAVVVVLGTLGFLGDRLVVWSRTRFVFWEKGASL
jgi:ABC-type nitrate/sulfonate/bicarbonate transport system permease component